LVRMLEGGGGSVAGSKGGAKPATVGDPVFSRPRFKSVADVMGRVPVVSAALGPVAGFPAARLAASHFSVMVKKTSQILIAGPQVVNRALNENLTKEQLGGFKVHQKSGVVDNVAKNEDAALAQVRQFLSYMPTNVDELAPVVTNGDDPNRMDESLLSAVPRNRRLPFDMRKIIKSVCDVDSFFEMSRKFGPGIITGLARLNGQPVGILGNDCNFYAGAMSAEGSMKARRFMDMCNMFHLPIVSLVDEPGFMIGSASEQAATIRHGTSAVMAAVQSVVPWATVIIKKVYGVAGAAHFGPDGYTLAWPSAETGALPVEGGVAVAFGREIAAAEDPAAKQKELEDMLASRQSAFPLGESFSFHDVIDPRETRPLLCQWICWQQKRLEQLKGEHRFTIRP
jgi:acetyl-CoA carboxylase carboxyltransferase component